MIGKVNRNRQRGKSHQKKTATALNGLNIGTLGGVDVITDKYAVECKSVAKFVGKKWYEQAVKNSIGKEPIVSIHITGTSYEKDFILMSIETFKKMHEYSIQVKGRYAVMTYKPFR